MRLNKYSGVKSFTILFIVYFLTILILSVLNINQSKLLIANKKTIGKLNKRNKMLVSIRDKQKRNIAISKEDITDRDIKRNERKKTINNLKAQLSESRRYLASWGSIKEKEYNREMKRFLHDNPSSDFQILYPGYFDEYEIACQTERLEWCGIIKQANNYILKKMKLNISQTNYGSRVMVTDSIEPFILISGLDNIKEGKIESIELMKNILLPGETMMLELNGDKTLIRAYGTVMPRSPGHPDISHYFIEIQSLQGSITKKQILAGANGFDDTMFSINWAGDIDGDGALDLIMDLSTHYNSSSLTLFLSSKAEEGQLLKRVSCISTKGC